MEKWLRRSPSRCLEVMMEIWSLAPVRVAWLCWSAPRIAGGVDRDGDGMPDRARAVAPGAARARGVRRVELAGAATARLIHGAFALPLITGDRFDRVEVRHAPTACIGRALVLRAARSELASMLLLRLAWLSPRTQRGPI